MTPWGGHCPPPVWCRKGNTPKAGGQCPPYEAWAPHGGVAWRAVDAVVGRARPPALACRHCSANDVQQLATSTRRCRVFQPRTPCRRRAGTARRLCGVEKGTHQRLAGSARPTKPGPRTTVLHGGSRRCRRVGTARRLLLAGTVARTMFSGWQSTQRRQGCPLSAKCGVQRRQCNLTAQRQHGVASARAPPGTGCLHSIAATRCCRSIAGQVHTRPACLPGCRTGPTPD